MADDILTRLRWAREASGLSARSLSHAAGLAGGHYSLLERGKFAASVATVSAIAAVFGVSLDWLVNGVGESPDPEALRASAEAAVAARRASDADQTGPQQAIESSRDIAAVVDDDTT